MRTAVKAQTRCEQAADLSHIVLMPSQQTLLPIAWWQSSAAERRMPATLANEQRSMLSSWPDGLTTCLWAHCEAWYTVQAASVALVYMQQHNFAPLVGTAVAWFRGAGAVGK